MSQKSTPYLGKRTAGSWANENSKFIKPALDSSNNVSDAHASNPKQLLNAYIYDFLVKNKLSQTAKIFANEADVPSLSSAQSSKGSSPTSGVKSNGSASDSTNIGSTPPAQFYKENNLPMLSLSMDTPQGFLYEWWQLFWDVFQAKGNINSASSASKYLQMQMQNVVYPQEFMMSRNQASVTNNGAQTLGAQHPVQPQMQIQPNSIQHQVINTPGNHMSPNILDNQLIGQMQGQQNFSQSSQLDPQRQQRYMMQMMMKQQQPQMIIPNNYVDQQQQFLGNMLPNGAVNIQQHQKQQAPPQPKQQTQPRQPQPQPQQPQQQQQQQQQQQHLQQQQHHHQQQQHQQQQQMFLSSQQQQSQNRMQRLAQNHMNHLRQDNNVAVQSSQQQSAQAHMNNLRQQKQPLHSPPPQQQIQQQTSQQSHQHQNGTPHQPLVQSRVALGQVTQDNLSTSMNSRMGSQMQQQVPNGVNAIQFQAHRQSVVGSNVSISSNFNNNQPPLSGQRSNSVNMKDAVGVNEGINQLANANNIHNRNINALQDYQMQLMLLEKQNKKRLDIAKNNNVEVYANGNPGMLPPRQLQPENQNHGLQRTSPTAVMNSPLTNTEPSPNLTNKKKDIVPKKARKSSHNQANSLQANGNTVATNEANTANGTGADSKQLKKEYSTPLTPNSEANDIAAKRKRKSAQNNDSPNKQSRGSALESRTVNETDFKEDRVIPETGDSMSNANDTESLMFSVDILGNTGAKDKSNYLDGSNRNELDEIDFDLNQFLDSGNVSGLHESISNYNWDDVNVIENGE